MNASEAFWPWAVRQYGHPKVQSSCLDLQDRHGHCVPYLLWAAWMAATGRGVEPRTLAEATEMARTWATEVIDPLRQVRRRLKDAGAEDLRRTVKAAELEAEQALMAWLEALAPEPGEQVDLERALIAAGRLWNPDADLAALKHFATMFR